MTEAAIQIARPVGDGLSHPRRAVAIVAVLSAMAMVVLDANMANTALPTLAAALGASPRDVILVITAYQAALVMSLLPMGAVGERHGHRPVFAGGVALFAVGSVLCAFAPSLPWLVAARFVQGVGGAAVMALGVALLRFAVPSRRLGSAIGWNAMTVALASAAGPATGAAIVTAASWRWLFLAHLPIAVIVLAAAGALPRAGGRGERLDVASAGLNALAFACLILGGEFLIDAPALAAGLFAAAAGAATLLVRRELPKAAPLIPLDLLRAKTFRLSVIASVCCFAGQTAGLVALPFWLAHEYDLSVGEIGAYMTVWPLSVAATAIFAGRLADRVSAGALCLTGASILGIGLTAVPAGAGDPRSVLPGAMLCGVGFALFQSANNRNLFLAAPTHRSGAAGGMQGTARLTGQTLGALLVTLLFAATASQAAPRLAFFLGAAMALAAAVVSGLQARRI